MSEVRSPKSEVRSLRGLRGDEKLSAPRLSRLAGTRKKRLLPSVCCLPSIPTCRESPKALAVYRFLPIAHPDLSGLAKCASRLMPSARFFPGDGR